VSAFARVLKSVPCLPSRGEFFEEMASVFGDEKPVYTHFYQWLVSISLHVYLLRTFARKFSNTDLFSETFTSVR